MSRNYIFAASIVWLGLSLALMLIDGELTFLSGLCLGIGVGAIASAKVWSINDERRDIGLPRNPISRYPHRRVVDLGDLHRRER